MRYMLIIHNDPELHPTPGSPEWDQLMADYGEFSKQLVDRGHTFTGDPLNDPSTATTVRVRDGETLTVDGPFAETKEWMSGYYIVDFDSLDHALAVCGHGPLGQVRLGRGASRGGDVALGQRAVSGRSGPVDGVLESVYRADRGRVLARLIGILGDFDLAEEALQDAWVAATVSWPTTGIPDNPAGWLVTTARRKAVDRLRSATASAPAPAGLGGVGHHLGPRGRLRSHPRRSAATDLHLLSPALSLEAQVALTLRSLGGLTTEEVAKAFLISETALAQRVVRAKRKIREAAIAYRVPSPDELAGRLGAVLAVIYLIFNAGYLPPSGVDWSTSTCATRRSGCAGW